MGDITCHFFSLTTYRNQLCLLLSSILHHQSHIVTSKSCLYIRPSCNIYDYLLTRGYDTGRSSAFLFLHNFWGCLRLKEKIHGRVCVGSLVGRIQRSDRPSQPTSIPGSSRPSLSRLTGVLLLLSAAYTLLHNIKHTY